MKILDFLLKYTGLGNLIITLSKYFRKITVMEKFDIKAYGNFISNEQGTIFSIGADIYKESIPDIDITDIKIELKDINLYCFLEGDIITATDNNHIVINTGALNFSNKYDQVKMPNIRPFRIQLTSDMSYLKIFNTYLCTKTQIYSDHINADIVFITKYSIKEHGLLTKTLNRIYYNNRSHFVFLREVDRIKEEIIKRHEGFEIELKEENNNKNNHITSQCT